MRQTTKNPTQQLTSKVMLLFVGAVQTLQQSACFAYLSAIARPPPHTPPVSGSRVKITTGPMRVLHVIPTPGIIAKKPTGHLYTSF